MMPLRLRAIAICTAAISKVICYAAPTKDKTSHQPMKKVYPDKTGVEIVAIHGKSLREENDTRRKRAVALALGLHRDSPLPGFAKRLTAQQAREHADINEWNRHRSLIEQNATKLNVQKVPSKFKPIERRFRFKKTRASRGQGTSDDPFRTTDKERLQCQLRKAKLKVLQLNTDSALPAFAYHQSLEKVKDHGELARWHDYRKLLEAGKNTSRDLPPQFQPARGTLRYTRPNVRLGSNDGAALEKWKSMSTYWHRTGEISTASPIAKDQYEPIQPTQSSIRGDDNDPWEVLRDILHPSSP